MKKLNFNLCLCLCLPIVTILIIALKNPTSGVGMIFKGLLILTQTVIITPAGLLMVWLMPFAAAILVSVLMFKIRASKNQAPGGGDYACAAISGACALLLTLSIGPTMSFCVLLSCVTGFLAYGLASSGGTEDLGRHEKTFVLSALILPLLLYSALFSSVEGDVDKLDKNIAPVSMMYTIKTPEAFAQDDARILPLIEADKSRLTARRWMMYDAQNARGFPHSEGGEVIDSGGRLPVDFRCKEGILVEQGGLTAVSAALARRVCAKRADPSL